MLSKLKKHWKKLVLLPYIIPLLMFLAAFSQGSVIGGLLTVLIAAYLFVGYTVLLLLALVIRFLVLRSRQKSKPRKR